MGDAALENRRTRRKSLETRDYSFASLKDNFAKKDADAVAQGGARLPFGRIDNLPPSAASSKRRSSVASGRSSLGRKSISKPPP